MCQENAGNSADECLPYSRIAISAIFSTGAFCRMHFRLPPMSKFSAFTTKMLVLGTCESASKILTRSKGIPEKRRGGSPLCVRVLIKAVSVNIDIEYRDICCQNIEYRIEIEKAYRPITNTTFLHRIISHWMTCFSLRVVGQVHMTHSYRKAYGTCHNPRVYRRS
jgi:hypothetical protein